MELYNLFNEGCTTLYKLYNPIYNVLCNILVNVLPNILIDVVQHFLIELYKV